MSIRKNNQKTRTAGASVLRKERTAKSVSQTELAKRLGVSQPLVSSWESGRITMGIEDVVAIENALGVERGSMLHDIAFAEG